MRAALALSVLLNAMLGTAIVAARVEDRTMAVSNRIPPTGAIDTAPPVFDAGPLEAPSYYARLRRLGLSHDETKPLLLKHLRDAFLPLRRVGVDKYWRSGVLAALERRLVGFEAEAPIRDMLRAVYGDEAETDSAFTDLFRPLQGRLPFLSSNAQLALRHDRLVERIERVRVAVECRKSRRSSCVDPEQGAMADQFTALRGLADEATLFEVAVRESVLAEQLRNAGVEFTEDEFRTAYRILSSLEGMPAPADVQSARAGLRETLGPRRFDRLWAGRDPVFGVVARVLDEHGFGEDQQFAAYGVINRAQDELIEAAMVQATNAARAAELVRAASTRETAQLTDLLGEPAAKRLLVERSRALHQLSVPP